MWRSSEPMWVWTSLRSGVEGVVIPTHTVAIVGMGLLIVDNADLDALAETAARLNRWEFMFTSAPLPVTGATGSLLNAIATFRVGPEKVAEATNKDSFLEMT
jgi:hypothetical protein